MVSRSQFPQRKLPIPYQALVAMTKAPPHPIFETLAHLWDEPATVDMFVSTARRYLEIGMVKPGDLIPISHTAFSLFSALVLTRTNPEQDNELRLVVALTWQLVNNVLDLMDNMVYAIGDAPLAYNVAVVLKFYPDPITSANQKEHTA